MTELECQAFRAEPRTAVLSVANDEGRPPQLTPLWYSYQPGGNVTFFTNTQGRITRKARLIDWAGTVRLVVQHGEFPYKFVTVESTIVQIDRPPSADQMFAVTSRCLPERMVHGFVAAALADPGPELVLYTVRPDRWLSFDFSDDAA